MIRRGHRPKSTPTLRKCFFRLLALARRLQDDRPFRVRPPAKPLSTTIARIVAPVNQAVRGQIPDLFSLSETNREAMARMVIAAQREPDADLISRLQAFVQRDFSAYIVIAVSVDSTDQRYLGPIMQQINSATSGSLKNKTYLETADGRRLFLTGYQAPIADGLGAKFIFPRRPNGEEFLKDGTSGVRFVAEFSDSFKLNMRFKVSDMIYDNKREY
jgi:hypothetical protein